MSSVQPVTDSRPDEPIDPKVETALTAYLDESTSSGGPAYQVPKRKVLAQVVLKGHARKDIQIYLCDCGESQWGQERPSDLLNAGNGFIPVTDTDSKVLLLQREAVMLLTVPAEHEVGAGYPEEVEQAGVTTTHQLELLLEDGTSLSGSVTYLRPAGRRRLQDFLNNAELFFPVRTGDLVQLVNRSCVVSVSPAVDERDLPQRRAEDTRRGGKAH